MAELTVAVCTYNRSDRLPALVRALDRQESGVPYEILIVDNNSSDDTPAVLGQLGEEIGPKLRYVRETAQGIPYARNRAIEEAIDSDYFLFMDDDELPEPGILVAAVDALNFEDTVCAGGRVKVVFDEGKRPGWLGDELLGFLAAIDYGDEPFQITDASTPVWTANVAYRMSLFRENPDLRFDSRYTRLGMGIGGGSDRIMFKELLERKVPMRYCPGMVVDHHVEDWRLKRSYFLKLHFISGRKYGQFETGDYRRTFLGVPPFMVAQAARHVFRTLGMFLVRRQGVLRQAMNAAHAFGTIWGRFLRWRQGR